MQDMPSYHKKMLYVIAGTRNIELKYAMVDEGSSLNVIPLSILVITGVLRIESSISSLSG